MRVITRRDAALRLDIPLEMAKRHGLPPKMTVDELVAIERTPPAWLVQSRANRTGKPVWVELECVVCGYHEVARPKKWWPEYTYLSCDDHGADELPEPEPGVVRAEVDGVGTRFVAIVDVAP